MKGQAGEVRTGQACGGSGPLLITMSEQGGKCKPTSRQFSSWLFGTYCLRSKVIMRQTLEEKPQSHLRLRE